MKGLNTILVNIPKKAPINNAMPVRIAKYIRYSNQLNETYSTAMVTAMVRPVRASHTVCAFSVPEGALWFFDNDSLRRFDCKTYADVADIISKHAKRLVCWDARNPATLDMIEFHKV